MDPESGLLVKTSLGILAQTAASRKPLESREGPQPKVAVQGIAIWNPPTTAASESLQRGSLIGSSIGETSHFPDHTVRFVG